MSQERLIRLAESHRDASYTDGESSAVANAIADSIRDELARASEIELVDFMGHSSLGLWVAFYVLEAPQKYPFLVDQAVVRMQQAVARGGVESFAARQVLAMVNSQN